MIKDTIMHSISDNSFIGLWFLQHGELRMAGALAAMSVVQGWGGWTPHSFTCGTITS